MLIEKLRIIIGSLIFLTSGNLYSQSSIDGKLMIDTTIWNSVIYLSIISDFDELNSMSNEMIIEQSNIDDAGGFKINTQFLPDEDYFYRLHISKKSDPPASLIIGGKDENHIFIIANRESNIHIIDTSIQEFIKDVRIDGYYPNNMLQQVDGIASYLDSTSFNGSTIKKELIRGAIFEKLRSYADTCSNPLVSLYAIYRSNFDKNYPVNQSYYRNFLAKWKKEKSSYFEEFRKKIPISKTNNPFVLAILFVTVFAIGFLISKVSGNFSKKGRHPIFELSGQERKIFALIISGKSNKEISDQLNIGLSTVKSHINSIYSKLDINSRKEILNINLDKKDDPL